MIISDADMLARIERFLEQTQMPPTTFGRRVLNDGALVTQLRAGTRSLTLKSAAKIDDFMSASANHERAA